MGVVPFNSYNQATNILATQGEIGTYGDLALALENNPGWRVIDGGKTITNPVVTGADKVVPITNYIKTAPELEGGVVGATEMVEVTEASGGAGVVATSEGLATAWTVATVVTAILQGCNLGIKAYEFAPEFWTGLSNRLFGTEIAYEDIKDYKIVGTIKEELFGTETQNTTYLPYETVQTILNYCTEYGVFNTTTEAELHDTYVNNNWYNVPLGSVDNCIDAWLDKFIEINAGNSQTPFLYFASNKNYIGQTVKNLKENYNGVLILTGGGYMPNPYSLAGIYMNVYFFNASNPRVYFSGEKTYLGCHGFQLTSGVPAAAKHVEVYVSYSSPVPQFTVNTSGWGRAYTGLYADNYPLNNPLMHTLHCSNLGMDYETLLPPYIYTFPDGDTYNPNQTIPQQYPDWYNRMINTNGIKLPYDDPSLYPIPWIPVAMPEYDPMTQPEKYPDPGTSPEPSPYPAQEPQPWAQRGRMPERIPTPYPDPNPDPQDVKNPRTGEDDPVDDNPPTNPTPTPPIVFPTVGGEANAIFTVYKPILSELNSLAGVLWSSNFLENLIKIFTNNPMDAIISLHMLYATPSVSGRQNIKLGCYDSGVAADVVNKQYLQIDCGTVKIPEYFGDVRDYVNSVVDVYLPFVGMRHLKTQDIVGSYVTIKAGVDVFTGTILYTINIRKSSGINQIMYAFEGNCAVALPLTGADKSRMFSVLGAAATGGAIGGVGGALVGAFTSMMNGSQQADIQRTGNFGANSGAMGVKKPYIVVSRNTPYDAESYSYYHGYPANKTVQLSNCTGFTRVLDCRVDGISGATDTEKRMIEEALKRGVII